MKHIIPNWYILSISNVIKFCQVYMAENRIKELRKRKKITQIKLAIELGTTQTNISRYESGEREADYATLIRIAEYFNVSIDYLLCRTEKP